MKHVVLLLLAASVAFGQVVTGTIQGTVTDSSGGVIAGASVTVQNAATGFKRTGRTNETGVYNLPFLPTGEYQVQVELQGFQTAVRKGVTIAADQRAVLDFTLAPGSVTETVTVVEAAPLVNRASSELGEVLQRRTV
ncbi:MAG: carboxypeptidase regulatory-like domain-containing protein, partial [Acidobacteria bacterium]|nr:carboxypeptidase regulatory-like domain-containing protein [Acidobacteriota bacterium]